MGISLYVFPNQGCRRLRGLRTGIHDARQDTGFALCAGITSREQKILKSLLCRHHGILAVLLRKGRKCAPAVFTGERRGPQIRLQIPVNMRTAYGRLHRGERFPPSRGSRGAPAGTARAQQNL